ncbi:hypothetical protein KFL_001650140 [Klebsormidium nitens]|uniref:Uncharacterized protein n=1 Tax=Klebsormidium nitens TaxID=105231 RepID=A0A1Y1I3W5_KLENI|nr:hypothetical protein KFL_001650140 [Klebsormidium nitens]|eukprot:GAQ83861.1 hypothetical protein KFL_001650140 [Klebsormidium nitens]
MGKRDAAQMIDEAATSYDPPDLNETIIGSIDEGIRTRRQIASILHPFDQNPHDHTPPDTNPEPSQPNHKPLKPLSTSQVALHLNATFPGRAPQVNQFLNLLGEPGERGAPILVWGFPNTGKTSIVRGALRLLGRPHAYVSCRSSSSPRMIYEGVIEQLAGYVRSAANDYAPYVRCTDLSDFVQILRRVCITAAAKNPKPLRGCPPAATKPPNPTPQNPETLEARTPIKPSRQSPMDRFPSLSTTNFVVVFDHAELLRTDEMSSPLASLVPAFSRLSELTRVSSLTVVFVSRMSWDAFETGTGERKPQGVHFPDYLPELKEILSKGRPPLYPGFSKMVLPPSARITRWLTQLDASMEPLFRKYLEPIDQGKVERAQAATETGGRRLYATLLPHLRAAMGSDVSFAGAFDVSRGDVGRDDVGTGAEFEMSGACRLLLIAAFVASRNPASLDSAYLDDEEGGRKKKRRRKSGGVSEQVRRDVEVEEEHLRGPLSFPIERLAAIFHCIARDYLHVAASAGSVPGREDSGVMHRQLLTLLGVGLVSKTGGDPIEGGAKYRCNASKELAEKIARSVRFPLASYLLHG